MAPQGLRPGEEAWQPLFERLCERFPTLAAERVAETLRASEGHAGNAAAVLRDLASSSVKQPDADDVEHVATLLSSPAMFKHACKEQFDLFDADGNGVLDVDEVITLTNAMYSSFGLQVPSEGSVRAFFLAMDDNNDGVLSEREFRRFFEMFLRFAFFDVAKLRQIVEKGNQKMGTTADGSAQLEPPMATPIVAPRTMPEPLASVEDMQPDPRRMQRPASPVKVSDSENKPRRRFSPQESDDRRACRRKESDDGSKTPKDSRDGSKTQKDSRNRRRSSRAEDASKASFGGGMLRCVASSGVAYRHSSDYNHRSDLVCHQGDRIQVLEHWVRTEQGWLPLADHAGRSLFQVDDEASHDRKVRIDNDISRKSPCAAASAMEKLADKLGNGEEDWQERWDRLSERFPKVPREKILQALRQNQGHAGMVANMLRDM